MEITRRQLLDAFNAAGTDKGIMHGYDQMYYEVFSKLPSISKMLEIGIFKGASLNAWRAVLPDAELVGIDRTIRTDIPPETYTNARIIEANSARSSVKEIVGTGYDVIIDDGDHRPDWQWQTFLNLEGCWDQVYIIEDVMSADNEKLLRRRLASKGYTKIQTYSSLLTQAPVQNRGVMEKMDFFGIVVYR
jgi:hypothetical protein